MPISKSNEFLFNWAREISQNHTFWDFHVHPFCVLSGNTNYQPNINSTSLYSIYESSYRPPKLEEWLDTPPKKIDFQSGALSESALLLSSKLIYTFSGPTVFSNIIDQIGISNIMLLPVVRGSGDSSQMVEEMVNMFSSDSRFKFGCPLPGNLPPAKVDEYIQEAVRRWNVQCIKVHPNLSGIDPLSQEGKTILHSLLEIAGKRNLPIVVHGGRTPGLSPFENQEFATMTRLSEIDWSKSSAPVIIAHSGCYGLDIDELDTVIRILDTMLSRHSNLMVDTSALELPVLQQLMTKIDRKRFIFGSDALYFSIWSGWLALLKVLTSISTTPEEDLIQIASVNPQNSLPSLG